MSHSRLCKFLEQVCGIGVMYIIIATSVSQEEMSVIERRNVINRATDVTQFVLVWSTHKSLCIDRVVVKPIGNYHEKVSMRRSIESDASLPGATATALHIRLVSAYSSSSNLDLLPSENIPESASITLLVKNPP